MTKKDIRMIIGENIRRERISRHVSVDEFALMLDVTPGYVGLIERGQRGTTASILRKVASIFGLSMESFFEKYNANKNASDEIDKGKALKAKLSSLVFDFSVDELEYITTIAFGLQKLRRLDEEENI